MQVAVVGHGPQPTAAGGWVSTAEVSIDGTHYRWQVISRPGDARLRFTLEAEYTTRQRYSGELLNESEDRPIAFVAARGDERFVVFRGTQTIAEWTTNITYSQLDYPFIEGFGRSHRGFTRVYQSIRDELLATLTEDMATGEVSRLWITGHSLGGALAAIAAPDLIEQTGLDTVVYSFAAPRAGDPAFRERFGDMVPTRRTYCM